MEVRCRNGTLRMQGIAANQRRTDKEMITYSKLRGSNLYCKCSSLEDVIIWGLPRTRICLSSHELPAKIMQGFDFQRGFPPFGCKNLYSDPLEDSEPTMGALNRAWRSRPIQEHQHRASHPNPPLVKKQQVYTRTLFCQPGMLWIDQHANRICTNLLSRHPLIFSTYNTLTIQKKTVLMRCFAQTCFQKSSPFSFYWGLCVFTMILGKELIGQSFQELMST